MNSDDVIVKCNQCGGNAKASEFVLDADYKKMVCPNCIRNKGMQKQQQAKQEKTSTEPPKPAGWDHEDEEIERLHKEKKAREKPHLDIGMKLKCKKCDYEFIFKGQRMCPYCDMEF